MKLADGLCLVLLLLGLCSEGFILRGSVGETKIDLLLGLEGSFAQFRVLRDV